MMKSAILSTAERVDGWLPPATWSRTGQQQRLTVVLVHTLYHRDSEPDQAGVFPHERMTIAKFRQFLECFLEMEYTFLAPAQLRTKDGLPHKAMMLTFDDGYYNFVHALPLLREYQLPVTLFICPGYIASGESFWWDAYYRHARAHGAAEAKTRRQMARLRSKSFKEVRSLITERWGKHALRWSGDLDRPLTLEELQEIAREPLVHLGNHTLNHSALPFQSESTMRSEIGLAEQFLERVWQQQPRIISYPNGDYSDVVVSLCSELGYELGMTIDARPNLLLEHSTKSELLSLGRFMLAGERDVKRQAHSIDRLHSVSAAVRRLKNHKYK